MFKKSIKKYLSATLIVFLVFFYSLGPILVYADDTSLTPTPTPTTDPSLTPTDTPSPTPDPTLTTTDASNSANLNNTIDSNANTGDNSLTATDPATMDLATPSASTTDQSSSGSSSDPNTSSIQTGDAASVVNVENAINTTSINSTVIDQTLNIYVAQNGDLNLSDPFTVATDAIQTHPNDSVINVSFTNINNYAYLTNDITSLANTGGNTANQSAIISTGNAYSIVSLLNQVNFTVTNSQIHILTINIFGTLNGNIILPDVNASTNCSGCGVNLTATNSADLTNNLSSNANTGDNDASGSASITTGDAQNITNDLNFLNTNLIGTNAQVLLINVLGSWIGNFIGWGNLNPQQGGATLAFFNLGPSSTASGSGNCSSCAGNLNLNNFATVLNNINSQATSGNNSLTGNGSIATGNAFSAISLVNFINSNFINSFGFFGFINIFGNWTGDIGGLSNFQALQGSQNNNNQNNDSPQSNSSNNDNNVLEQGGQLSITNKNNVGAFVYPEDTVTFFINIKNTGTGKVYGTKLKLFLIHNDQVAGGATFDIGDIPAQTGKELNTGFVLSKQAPGGLYIARAIVTGNVGPDNHFISAGADSEFSILNNLSFITNQTPHVSVLGSQNNPKNNTATESASSNYLLLSLILVLTAYFLIRGIKKREYLKTLLLSKDMKEKVYSLRIFLV